MMNERIKQLAEQATSYTWNGNDVTEELDEQKFAELIVRESIELLKQNDYHGEWLGEKIKEHFGVNDG